MIKQSNAATRMARRLLSQGKRSAAWRVLQPRMNLWKIKNAQRQLKGSYWRQFLRFAKQNTDSNTREVFLNATKEQLQGSDIYKINSDILARYKTFLNRIPRWDYDKLLPEKLYLYNKTQIPKPASHIKDFLYTSQHTDGFPNTWYRNKPFWATDNFQLAAQYGAQKYRPVFAIRRSKLRHNNLPIIPTGDYGGSFYLGRLKKVFPMLVDRLKGKHIDKQFVANRGRSKIKLSDVVDHAITQSGQQLGQQPRYWRYDIKTSYNPVDQLIAQKWAAGVR